MERQRFWNWFVGANVDRTETNHDKIILDFVNRFYKCELRINNSTNAFTILVSDAIKRRLDDNPISLIPIPVDRGSSDTIHIVQADVKVIDDVSGSDDALGIVLTYGGVQLEISTSLHKLFQEQVQELQLLSIFPGYAET